MKALAWVLVIVAAVSVGVMEWQARIRRSELREQIGVLQTQRDSAMAVIEALEDQAEEAQVIVDSLVTELGDRKVEAAQEIAALEEEADSLQNALLNAVADTPVADTVTTLVERMFAAHRAEIAEYQSLLQLSDSTIAKLQEQVGLEQRINASLRYAISVTEQERDLWKAAQPGWTNTLKKVAIGVGIGVVAWEVIR